MLKSLQVATKVRLGWGQMPREEARPEVRVKMTTESMSLGELLYWALMGEEAGVRG